jgi:hypothetical protein
MLSTFILSMSMSGTIWIHLNSLGIFSVSTRVTMGQVSFYNFPNNQNAVVHFLKRVHAPL